MKKAKKVNYNKPEELQKFLDSKKPTNTGMSYEDVTPTDNLESKRYRMILFGVFNIGLYCFNLFNYKNNFEFLQSFLGHDMAGMIVYVFGMFFGLWFLVWRGFLFIGYSRFGQIDPAFSKERMFSGSFFQHRSEDYKDYSNIQSVVDYANNKCNLATNKETMETMSKLGYLDVLSKTSEGKRTLSYIDCKLATMSREEGYKFVVNGGK